jgi:hypothetical protein
MDLRDAYIAAVRRARSLLGGTGLLDALQHSDHRSLRHLRTLFAIYDVDDLATLDLPWWTYGAIAEVERFLSVREEPRAFEFGSGASTVWLAQRGVSVHSVEHDAGFADLVRRLIPPDADVELHVVEPRDVPGVPSVRSQRKGFEHLEFAEYVETIERVGGDFDLIIIDGRARLDSLRMALPHIADTGIVLFDDISRRRYRPALTVEGFTAQVIKGATPCVPYPTSTALLRPTGP